MKIMKRLILFFITFLCTRAFAQMGILYNADNQLPSNYVSHVYLDQDGYIWIATRNGISKFDGYQFQTFNNQENHECNLKSNYINHIMQARNGRFFISESNGLQYYDGGVFHDIEIVDTQNKEVGTYVTSIIQRKNGDIIASTSGYGILDIKGNKASKITKGIYNSLNYITKIAEDHRGNLWVLTEDQGLVCISGGKAIRYFEDVDRSALTRDIWIDHDNNIYIILRGLGLFLKKHNESTFRRIKDVYDDNMESLFIDSKGQILIGTDGHGIFVYNPRTHEVKNNPYYCWGIDLSRSKVYSILEDRNGNLWFGIIQKGLFMQQAHHVPFGYMGYKLGTANIIGTNSIASVLYDHAGRIWIGTDKDGMYLLDNNRKLVRHFSKGIPSTFMALEEDALGRIWAGSYGEGFGYFDSSLSWHKVEAGLGSLTSVFALESDNKGNVWIGSMGQGLVLLRKDGTITHYRMKKGAEHNNRINSLPNDYIQFLRLSNDGRRLYICTSVGISCMDIAKGNFTNVFGRNCLNYGHTTRYCHEDNYGHLWIGTDNGLLRYNLKTHKEKLYTIKDGISCNDIMAICQDKQNQLWISTSNGLNRLNLSTGDITCYFSDNGLQGNEFGSGALSTSPSGEILFGGTGGISWFNPSQINIQKWNARVRISGITVGNRQLSDSLVYHKSNFVFDHDENSLTVLFSTLTYEDSENITFLYSINGEEWERLQPGRNELTFARLSPGTYHIQVKALKDRFSSPVTEFSIKIKAPWYATTWAYLIYIGLIACGIWAYFQYRKKQEQDRLKLQEHIHAEEMGEAKLRFFMNMSHEIRTPMTLIISPLLQLLKEDHDVHRQSVYTIMRRNAERILHLINQMMDLRKIDKGLMVMHMKETDMVSFINDVYTLFTQQAANKKINLAFHHDDKTLPVWIDRSNFDKVLVNILSNAFKYTSAGGNIITTLTHNSKELKIAISDDGEPIPEDKLSRIFERFYQTPTAANDTNVGTGIGLDLTRSLVELHYGDIKAENNPDGKGCTFTVTLPLGKDHLKPEEIITEESTPAEGLIKKEEEIGNEDFSKKIEEMSSNGNKPSIAIAEDDDEIAHYLKNQLRGIYNVHLFPNGKEALHHILQNKPALVISDIMMPVMDGNTLCKKLKNNIITNDIPVILLTAKTLDEDRLEGLETGADAYIIKPFNIEILRRTIYNLIHQREMMRNKYNGNESREEKIDEIKMSSPDEKLMNKVMDIINKNLTNCDLSVDFIAKAAGVSRVQLYRKMKEYTNQTPHSFITNTRVKQAAKLLRERHQSIMDVMYACGFSSSASFSQSFKAVYGLSPRNYRDKYSAKS